jgi:hypothetical protein
MVYLVDFLMLIACCQNSDTFWSHKTIFRKYAMLKKNFTIHIYIKEKDLKHNS